ncbi:MAG: CDGSH iron-sulfur domain-containing protein [Nitrososphaerales archaeon]
MPSSEPASSKLSDKPKIMPIPNGPLYLINSSTPQRVENILDSQGKPIFKITTIALCRCGGSKNKPFCDGTHGPSGFSSDNNAPTQTSDKRRDYVGKEIMIHDNRRICSHSAECLRNLESVFRRGERPWINPDGAAFDAIMETVKKCPSGALSYSVDGVENRDQLGRQQLVLVGKNGPYYVTGGIELEGIENWAVGASREHYALCRCGASNNKPFCDGSHLSINFKDEKN